MAKEIYLIGVGGDGRDTLVPKTLKIIQDSHLVVGGKRVISQFEDLGMPTYAMTANLRQLVDVIEKAETAVMEGREVTLPAPRTDGGDDREITEDEEGGEDEVKARDGNTSDEEKETDAEGGENKGRGRRRGRRRTSPRSRGRARQEGDEATGDDNATGDDQGDADKKASRPSRASEKKADDTGEKKDVPETSVIDADDKSVSLSVPVREENQEEASEEAPVDTAADAATETATGVAEAQAEEKAEKKEEQEAPGTAKADAAAKKPEEEKKGDASAVARIVILASGDPNFYGLSKFLLERFKKEEITIVPHVSAMQLAFAAIKEPMNDAAITSSAGRNVDRLIRVVRQNAKVGIFTDKRRSPRAVAKLLRKHDIEAQCYVCQDLGTDRERIIMGTLEEITRKNFSPLSIMVLFKQVDESVVEADAAPQRSEGRGRRSRGGRDGGRDNGGRDTSDLKEMPPPTQVPKYELVTSLGIPDEMLAARPENMMRAETRVIVLSKLQLKEKSRLWDVGAGAGALSVEAGRVAHGGEVFSVERDFAQIRNIYENIKGFGLSNVTVMEGDIEELAKGLPKPDRIFIGGCGGKMKDVVTLCLDNLETGGIMCINATTMEALTEVQMVLKEKRLKHNMVIINISATVERSGLEYFEGFNPAYLVTTVKD